MFSRLMRFPHQPATSNLQIDGTKSTCTPPSGYRDRDARMRALPLSLTHVNTHHWVFIFMNGLWTGLVPPQRTGQAENELSKLSVIGLGVSSIYQCRICVIIGNSLCYKYLYFSIWGRLITTDCPNWAIQRTYTYLGGKPSFYVFRSQKKFASHNAV